MIRQISSVSKRLGVALFLSLVTAPAIGQATPVSVTAIVSSISGDAEEFLGASPADPVRWPAGFSYFRSSDLELGTDPDHGPQMVGLRFEGLAIPAGARISSVVLELTADKPGSGDLVMEVYFERAAQPSSFVQDEDASPSSDLSSRMASSSVQWQPGPWEPGSVYATPDLAAALQEVVTQPGWTSESAVVVILRPAHSSDGASRSAFSYDSNSEAAARLQVTYVEDAAAGDDEPITGPDEAAAGPDEAVTGPDPAVTRPERTDEEPDAAAPEGAVEDVAEPVQEDPAPAPMPVDPRRDDPDRRRYAVQPTHEAGVAGTVLISDYGLGRLIVAVQLNEPSPSASYRVSIHDGACDSLGGLVAMLEPIQGALGISTSSVDLDPAELGERALHINVFRLGEFTRLAGCANITP